MSYVFMKVLESAPQRYEAGMRLLTLGRLAQVRQDIAAEVSAGDRVLDIGCGTGALAVLLAKKGASVTAIDIAPAMVSQAARNVHKEGVADQVTVREMGAVDLDTAFAGESFDIAVSTLVFSELSREEIEYTLDECLRTLRRGGSLLIADEVSPRSVLGRIGGFLLRLPFAVAAFVLTQSTAHRVADLEGRIARAGFRIVRVSEYLAGTMKLVVAEKAG
jgi:ubiquinone/menaquinone biosynthesis C-methylase UbiE